MIYPRGGAAAGDTSKNPTDTTYAAIPPSSTYKGPKVAGTYGGFVGVFVAAGIVVLIGLTILALLRFRTLRKRDASLNAIEHGTDLGAGPRGGTRDDDEDDAFEMPRYERAGMESTLSFTGSDAMTPPLRQGERQLYGQDGVSQEAFYEPNESRTYDPYAESIPPKYEPETAHGEHRDAKSS
ncbi:uncharacterized protein JCM15063_002291 [Sporobolomyces koalae]|uniref:uncharacterized protein n=1 Tax=Sporobolomyces koalae TaxID=500713 RepID=UPI00317CC95C